MVEVQWSQLQRDPKTVAELADTEQEVRVKRRDGDDLILMRADRAAANREAILATARLLNALAPQIRHYGADELYEVFGVAFPWTRLLPQHELNEFARDFLSLFAASAQLDTWAPVEQLVHEWRQTARIYADPVLAAALTGPLDADLGLVPSPDYAEAG